MELHTIILAIVSILSLPVFLAYWLVSRRAAYSHLDVLVASDRNQPINLHPWKRLERLKVGIGVLQIVLLLAWGAVQLFLGPEKVAVDWFFTWLFAPSLLGVVLVSTHYDIMDLNNSMGYGQRAALRGA